MFLNYWLSACCDSYIELHFVLEYRYLQAIVIALITNTDKEYPTRVPVKTASKKDWIVINQIISIYKNRIIKKINKLSSKEINQVKAVIHETYEA